MTENKQGAHDLKIVVPVYGLPSRRISGPRSLLAEAPHSLLRRRLRILRTLISFPTDGSATFFRMRAHNHVSR